MRKILLAAVVITGGISLSGCGAGGDDPGRAYMPDMYYSRAYETYGYNNVGGERDSLRKRGIRYTGMPVNGTVARGDVLSYYLTADSAGLKKAEAMANPAAGVNDPIKLKEAERLYLIHCGICHGPKLDGNGPLFNGGNGPYPATPANLSDDKAKAWPDGHYFHVMTFGIRQMGSYASQLKPEQRWWIVNYIRSQQAPADSSAAATPLNTVPGGNVDSTQTTR
jgi:mono/diheme cytochrome c family protein